MSDCCTDHNKKNKEKKEEVRVEKRPKSFISKAFKDEGFIGKYLYKLGKAEVEKGKHSDKHKSGCC